MKAIGVMNAYSLGPHQVASVTAYFDVGSDEARATTSCRSVQECNRVVPKPNTYLFLGYVTHVHLR